VPDTGRSSLTAADVTNDQATFDNARLWDASPLAATLDQLQTVRQYYTFTSVNIDRYVINGQPTEVMLSAREMALANSQPNPPGSPPTSSNTTGTASRWCRSTPWTRTACRT